MTFTVLFHDEFAPEFGRLALNVRKAILQGVRALEIEGHQLGRPWVDTMKGSRHANMKELRATANKVEWRVAFAFDPVRQAILLAAVAKGGADEGRIYRKLVRIADERFERHVAAVETAQNRNRTKER